MYEASKGIDTQPQINQRLWWMTSFQLDIRNEILKQPLIHTLCFFPSLFFCSGDCFCLSSQTNTRLCRFYPSFANWPILAKLPIFPQDCGGVGLKKVNLYEILADNWLSTDNRGSCRGNTSPISFFFSQPLASRLLPSRHLHRQTLSLLLIIWGLDI